MSYYTSREEADDAWANAAYIPDADAYIDKWTQEAVAFREHLGASGRTRLDCTYGPSDRQRYDLFLPDGTPKGLMIFIHGGYWLRFDKSFWSHFAQGGVENGWAVAMPSYDLCPAVGIPDITAQITRAIETIAGEYPDLPIAITGHSAGGHLTARMLEKGRFAPELEARIARAVPISPVADLRPIMETSMNDSFKLDEATAVAESPTLSRKSLDIPITVWVGGIERPVFIEQAKEMSKAWECGLHIAEARHHFDVIDGLKDADAPLIKDLLRL